MSCLAEAMTLKMIQPGTRVIVQRLTGHGKITRRLMDMGIVPGTEMEVQKMAPLGDPLEVKFKGYNLSLRREEADLIVVRELPREHGSCHYHHQHRHRHRFWVGRLHNRFFSKQ